MTPRSRDAGPTVRVLHVIGALNVGGAEVMVMNLLRRTDRSRVCFDFVVYDTDPGAFEAEAIALGARVFRLPPPAARGVRRAVADLVDTIRAGGPYDAVHAHVLHASAIAMLAARRAGVPRRISHSHSTGDVDEGWVRRAYLRWARHVIRRDATDLVACGAEAGRYLFGDRSWTVLRNGVDLELFRQASEDERHATRSELGIGRESVVALVPARFDPVKNHQFLVRVMREWTAAAPSARLLLAGDGPLRARIQDAMSEAGVGDQVSFLGVRRDVARLLHAADVVLLPSRHEGIPVALVEAQGAGVLCLASEGVSREVDLGVGLVEFLPTTDPGAWAARLSALTPRETVADPEIHARAIREAGADIRAAAEALMDLYGVER